MNTAELATLLAKKTNQTHDQAKANLYTVLNLILEQVENGQQVKIRGFGTFKLHTRKKRKSYCPKTGETTIIEASQTIRFIPSRTKTSNTP